MDASQFIDRFVNSYWADVADNPPEFADHSDPCTETLDELLANVANNWQQNTPEHLAIQMSNTAGDAWRFVFSNSRHQWTIKSASSGTLPDIDRVDLLDETYVEYFRPFLDRVIATAQSNR